MYMCGSGDQALFQRAAQETSEVEGNQSTI